MNPPEPRPLPNESREPDLDRIGRWVMEMCLVFGCQFETACHVAGHFVAGLRKEWADG